MFENFTAEKPKRAKLRALAGASTLFHLALGGLLVVMGLWEIKEIGRPNRGVAMATVMPASSSSSPPPAASAERITPKRKLVRDARQPSQRDKPDTEAGGGETGSDGTGSGTGTDPNGTGTGTGSGIPGLELCLDAEFCGDIPAVAPPPTPEVKNLPSTVLSELTRVAGDAQIQPPSSTRNAMSKANQRRATAVVRMCLNKQGQVAGQSIVKSSGYADYDARLLTSIRRWRYQPYRANGMAVALCTQVTFIYQQD